MNDNVLRKVNIGLLIAIILVNLYTIVMPYLPSLSYWWRTRDDATAGSSVQTYLATESKPDDGDSSTSDEQKKGNRLIVPRMLLDTPIIEGSNRDPYAHLKKGAWHMPSSSNPLKGGNMVIAGHRFTYTESRSIFYYLDKLQVGDEIGLRWDGTLYTYRVTSSRTVPPTEVSIQEPTDDNRLTLYTCTPVWNPKDRLVVVAKPINEGAD